ncbi:hypothetical protein BDP81DRAFT_415711 [Colletotrichum phormii]|uniref:Uncharacterized protein n=1 Tax=Colletotrichum phormii TaxID=359342 RepID=A0AAJ0A0X9_9PEZI|nr:uncharacterized protein BDP81DRAFT_415711 [Colletotrichum phormii]KAK1654429.1 hypothetical protein BDP81DRAFT_415711 [Colletotrichum phormii]
MSAKTLVVQAFNARSLLSAVACSLRWAWPLADAWLIAKCGGQPESRMQPPAWRDKWTEGRAGLAGP